MFKKEKIIICILILLIGLISIGETFISLNKVKISTDIPNKQTPVEIKEPVKEIEHFNRLMIVAHPDDDTIFGGAHLLKDEFVVVCVTCGINSPRLKEFKKVMVTTEDKYIYLKHSDLVKGFISNWYYEESEINDELENIINSRDWDLIVTHNPDGEYGHIHHKKLNKMVTSIVTDKSKLYYFGYFHEKCDIKEDDPFVLDNEILERKKELLSIYKSQRLNDKSRYLYMFSHEDWIKYEDWNKV